MPLDQKTILTAVKEAKEKSQKRKFNQSVELILKLQDIDMKAPESKIQEVVELPYALEKPNAICVIASGELAMKARRANADRVVEKNDLEAMAGKKTRDAKNSQRVRLFHRRSTLDAACRQNIRLRPGPEGQDAHTCSSIS